MGGNANYALSTGTGDTSSALATSTAGATATTSAGDLTSFASTAGESYALSSVETLTLNEGGGDTFALHEDGSFSAGSLSLASFSESEQSSETFAKHDALTESLLNGTGSSTLQEGSSANETSSGTSGDSFAGSSQDSLAAANSYSSGSTSTTGYQASGDPGHSGTSTYGYGGQDSLSANGSSTSAGGSAGTSSANGSATAQEDATSSYAFAGSDTRTEDESGGSNVALYEAGSAAAGAFSLTSYSMDERSSDTFSMHEQDNANTTGSAHDASSGTGSGNSQGGSNGSSSFAGGGRASFLAATGTSSDSGSQSANGQDQAMATSTRDETFADGSSLTQDQSGGESYHLFEAGVYANGSLSLGCIGLDESASSTFASSESLSDVQSGTEASAESGSGLGSYSGAGLGSLGYGSVGTYGSGGTSTSSLGAAGSFARGGNESYLFDASSSDSFGSTDTKQGSETGADSFALHEEGNSSNGSVSLTSYALSEGSADSFASHEQGNESQTNGSVQGHVQQSGAGSGSEGGSSNSSAAAVGLTGLGSAGTQSASDAGSWSQASGESYGYGFGDGQTFSLDDSGTDSLSLYEGGAYSNGSLSLSSYQLQENGSDTFAENDQSSEQVSNGQDASTFSDQGSAAGGQLGTGGYGFNAGGVAGVAGTSSFGQGGTVSQSDSGGQTTTLARTDSALNVRSGGDNYALQQAGQWSLGSYALNVYRLDESSGETFAASQTETDTKGGSAAESFGSSAQGSASSGGQTGYAGATTQSGAYQGTSQQADSAGETWAFASVETATAGQSGGDSFALHEDGNFANGSLALSSYALSESSGETFASHDASSGTFGGGDTSGSNASGADSFARGAGPAYQFGGPGSWSSASAQSTSFTGAGSSTFDETGGQGRTEQESGTYGNGTLSLQSLSYGGWSADSYASHEGAAQSPTMAGASGGESERQDGGGLDSASYAGSGQYANGSLILNALRYDEENTQSATEHADGNPVEAGSSDAFVRDDVAGSHWLLHEAGGYGTGGLSLSSYGYEQDGSDSFAAHDAAQESTSSDTGQQTADDTSASSFALSESGSYAQGSFALTNYQDDETTTSRQTSSATGAHAAGTESLAWRSSADEQVRENLHATGAYNNGQLQLVSYAKGSSDDATNAYQQTASDGTSSETDSGDQAHHETDAVTGTGAWGTEAQQASDTSDTHQQVTGPNAFLSNVDATGGSGTSSQRAAPLPQQPAPPPLAETDVLPAPNGPPLGEALPPAAARAPGGTEVGQERLPVSSDILSQITGTQLAGIKDVGEVIGRSVLEAVGNFHPTPIVAAIAQAMSIGLVSEEGGAPKAKLPAAAPKETYFEQLLNGRRIDEDNPMYYMLKKQFGREYAGSIVAYYQALARSRRLPGVQLKGGKYLFTDRAKANSFPVEADLRKEMAKAGGEARYIARIKAEREAIQQFRAKVDLYAQSWDEIQNRVGDIQSRARAARKKGLVVVTVGDVPAVRNRDNWNPDLDYLITRSASFDRLLARALEKAEMVHRRPDAQGIRELQELGARIGRTYLALEMYAAIAFMVKETDEAFWQKVGNVDFFTTRDHLDPLHQQMRVLKGLLDRLQRGNADVREPLAKASNLLGKYLKHVAETDRTRDVVLKVLEIYGYVTLARGAFQFAQIGANALVRLRPPGGGAPQLGFVGGRRWS